MQQWAFFWLDLQFCSRVAGLQYLNHWSNFVYQSSLQSFWSCENISREGGGIVFDFVSSFSFNEFDKFSVCSLAQFFEVLLIVIANFFIGRQDLMEKFIIGGEVMVVYLEFLE